jgi:hypothetical protein
VLFIDEATEAWVGEVTCGKSYNQSEPHNVLLLPDNLSKEVLSLMGMCVCMCVCVCTGVCVSVYVCAF